MLLPSKLVCHRDRLSQPALMSKIVSVYGARENEKRDVEIISREKDDLWKNGKRRNHAKRERLYRLGGARASEREGERERRTLYRVYSTEMKIPFAVRYIKLVVECFESYHSHFDELGPQIDRQGPCVFAYRFVRIRLMPV